MRMLKTITALFLLPLLLSLEVGLGPLHAVFTGELRTGVVSTHATSLQIESVAPEDCPVCRFMQVSFLLAVIVFCSFFVRCRDSLFVREIAFTADPFRLVSSRGPPAY
jgi:hypothetical protein